MPVLVCMLYFKYSRMLITKIYVIHVQILKILYSNVFELRSVWKEKNLRHQNVISVPMYKIQRKKLWEKKKEIWYSKHWKLSLLTHLTSWQKVFQKKTCLIQKEEWNLCTRVNFHSFLTCTPLDISRCNYYICSLITCRKHAEVMSSPHFDKQCFVILMF